MKSIVLSIAIVSLLAGAATAGETCTTRKSGSVVITSCSNTRSGSSGFSTCRSYRSGSVIKTSCS